MSLRKPVCNLVSDINIERITALNKFIGEYSLNEEFTWRSKNANLIGILRLKNTLCAHTCILLLWNSLCSNSKGKIWKVFKVKFSSVRVSVFNPVCWKLLECTDHVLHLVNMIKQLNSETFWSKEAYIYGSFSYILITVLHVINLHLLLCLKASSASILSPTPVILQLPILLSRFC